jgi:hypothetical protein
LVLHQETHFHNVFAPAHDLHLLLNRLHYALKLIGIDSFKVLPFLDKLYIILSTQLSYL